LTIIGVVATITIPQLIENVNQKAFNESKELNIKKLTEATRQMQTNGLLTGYPTSDDFVDNFSKYMKITRRCTLSNMQKCFSENFYTGTNEEVEVSKLKTGANFSKDTFDSDLVGVGLANGTALIIAFDPDCPYASPYTNPTTLTSCLSLMMDVNGFAKPNKIGKDIFEVNATLKSSLCSGVEVGSLCVASSDVYSYSTVDTCDGTSSYDSNFTSAVSGSCNNNYWAGAKKYCDDIGMRLPTRAELNSLYQNYLNGGNTSKRFKSS
jgi:type II secretory pathway pseudopilin PulG